MDTIRDGFVNKSRATVTDDPVERANHLKSFAYFSDADTAGIGRMPRGAVLETPYGNPDIAALAEALRTRQTKTLASGIDMIMADLKESMQAKPSGIDGHDHVMVVINQAPRAPRPNEPGTEWLEGAAGHVAHLRATETAVVLANYIRLLGWRAKAHTATSSEIDLNHVAVATGLATVEDGALWVPYLTNGFGLAAITTDMPLDVDAPLLQRREQPKFRTEGPAWWVGAGFRKSALTSDPYRKRNFADGPHPFETLKRVDDPTTYIDEPNVARVPKRTDMFARAQFGDMGPKLQNGAKGGYYARKAAPSMAQRRMLGAFVFLQDGPVETDTQVQVDTVDIAKKLRPQPIFWVSMPPV